jgi:hypothetical protein
MADALSDAQELYREALDASMSQRRQIEEDLKFSDPSDPQQWDEVEKNQRETDPGGARPCLVMDQCSQYVANVAGQVEQRPPALHAIPVDGGADKRVAEQLDGFFRHIEHASRAQQHYSRGLTAAARAGVGYLIVRPEYSDRALNYQEPRISSEGDPLRVVFDPWSIELDGSDAGFGFLLTPLSIREFDRRFKGAERVSFGDETGRIVAEDERQSITVAEQWKVEEKTRNIIIFTDEQGGEASLPEDDFHQARQTQNLTFVRNYKDKYRCVRWSRMSGAAILTAEIDFPASGIGLVPVYGYVGWAGGRMTYCGIPRRAREPQRAYNFHVSEIRAIMAQAPKSPWLADIRSIKGLEKLWDRASVDQRAYLPFNGIDDAGNPIPAPTRPQLSVNLANHAQGAIQARADIQAALGMYQANLGAPSNETSGVAIEERKQQGEAATAHFPANLAASIGQVGRLCMDMIPRLIDTRRQLRILGIDMTPSSVVVDPKQTEALVEPNEGGLSINPNVGKYDARVVVGASFSTQRQQAQTAYTEMMRANPGMMPAIAPLWAQTLDVPHADKLAQVLTAVAPEPVKAILNPGQQESTAALKAENDRLKAALQEAVQVAEEAQQEVAGLQAEKEAKDDEVAVKAYEAHTKRLVGMKDAVSPEAIQAIVVQTLEQMLAAPRLPSEEIPGELPDEPPADPEAFQTALGAPPMQ